MSQGKKSDLTGKRFGKLLALYSTKERRSKSVVWKFRCDCGTEKLISSRGVCNGGTKSCGCSQYNYLSPHYLPNGESAFNQLYSTYKKLCAEKRNLELKLTKEEFRKLTKQNCVYCGVEPSNVRKSRYNNGDYIYNGIDRVNNDVGYTTKNSVPCCWDCNSAKKEKPVEKFIEWLERIALFRSRKLDEKKNM